MVIKYVIWSATSDVIPQAEASKFSFDNFRDKLVEGNKKEETARFSFYADAARYLQSLVGEIMPVLDEQKSAVVRGYYMQACAIREDGSAAPCEGKQNIRVCHLTDRRFPDDKNYFSSAMRTQNEDNSYREQNRPADMVGGIAFDKNLLNHILNKQQLQDPDKANIAAIYLSASNALQEANANLESFEKLLIGMMGEDWYMQACSGAAQNSMQMQNIPDVKQGQQLNMPLQNIPAQDREEDAGIDIEAVRSIREQIDEEKRR